MKELKQKKTIIIITGCPGSGKSRWADRIKKNIADIKLLSYDDIKEKNWDRFGFENAIDKDLLNKKSLDEFYQALDEEMKIGGPILIEYPFYERHRNSIIDLIEKYSYYPITLYLTGDLEIIYFRSLQRDSSGTRHSGHLLNSYNKNSSTIFSPESETKLSLEDFKKMCREKNYNIQIGKTFTLDVSNLSFIDNNAEDILGKIISL